MPRARARVHMTIARDARGNKERVGIQGYGSTSVLVSSRTSRGGTRSRFLFFIFFFRPFRFPCLPYTFFIHARQVAHAAT